ncbi:MAG: hypothetical protein IK136_04615, partial [Oscillospiraceae bacterium]|nr:hypothetical protein [Oscillospiraceae bacterium]
MTGSYDVRFRGEICGRLDVQKRGVLTEFSCDCDCVEKERVVRLVCCEYGNHGIGAHAIKCARVAGNHAFQRVFF